MRTRFVLMVGTAVTVLGVAVPRSAPAGDGERLVITERMQVTSFNPATGEGTQAGTFVAAGAVNDAGIAMATFRVTPGTDGCGVLTGPHTYTGSAGAVTVFTTGVLCPFPPSNPPRAFATGSWRVIGSSGAYQGIHGHGKVLATADFSTGEITIARTGEVERDE